MFVCADEGALSAVVAALSAAGRTINSGLDVPDQPWELDPIVVYTASGAIDPEAPVKLLVRGASVALCVPDTDRASRIWDEGRRIADTEWYDEEHRPLAEGLDEEHMGLLMAVASGMDIDAAARSVNLSTRTSARRLAKARSILGTTTNAAAATLVGSRIRRLQAGTNA